MLYLIIAKYFEHLDQDSESIVFMWQFYLLIVTIAFITFIIPRFTFHKWGKEKQSILFFWVIFNTWLYMKRVLSWLFHKDVFYPSKCQILTAMNSSLCSTSSDSVKISSVYKGMTFKQVSASIAYFKSLWLNSSQQIFYYILS